MWANTVWGLAGASLSCLLTALGMTEPSYWREWFIYGAVFFAIASVLTLLWPLVLRFARFMRQRRNIQQLGTELISRLMGEPPQVPASSKVKEWKKPLVAIELFSERALLETKNKWDEKFLKSSDLQANAEHKITELRKQAAKGADKSSSLRSENARLDVAAMGIRFAQDELKRAWAAIRQDIGNKLEKRILVAKGIAAPHAPGEKEMEIPAYEWRILEIDPIDETAVGKNDGKTKYLGVVIGRQD